MLIILLVVQIVNLFQHFFTMYLNALDRPRDSFKTTSVGVAANIVLKMMLIPVVGISGETIATLVTMGFYALLAQRALSGIMLIRLEKHTLLSIVSASVLMGILIGEYCILVSFSNVCFALVAVIGGGVV